MIQQLNLKRKLNITEITTTTKKFKREKSTKKVKYELSITIWYPIKKIYLM